MDIKDLCRKTYADFIDSYPFLNSELRRALKTHERIPVFIDNLAKDLGRLNHQVKRETVIKAVQDMTQFFIKTVEWQAQERLITPLEKALRKVRQSELAEIRANAQLLEETGQTHVTKTEKGVTERTTYNLDKIADKLL